MHHIHANVISFGHRGYSDSEGEPHEDGMKKDADAILKFLENPEAVSKEVAAMINKDLVFIHGKGTGGAEAIYMAHKANHLFRGLIAENAFTSMNDMVDHHYFFSDWIKWFIKLEWDNTKIVPDLTLPIIFIGGTYDKHVPYEQTKQLYQMATKAYFKSQYIVKEGRHNDLFFIGGDRYVAKIRTFMLNCIEKYEPGMIRGNFALNQELRDKRDMKNETLHHLFPEMDWDKYENHTEGDDPEEEEFLDLTDEDGKD